MEPSLSQGNRQPLQSELGPTSRESDRTLVSASMSWSELSGHASPFRAHLFECLGCGLHRLVADHE
jgi:hypothetical protein